MKRPTLEVKHRVDRHFYELLPGPLVLSIVILAFALASCDAVNPVEPLTLQPKTVTFRFEIDTEGVSSGQTIQIDSEESADLEQALSDDLYTKGEVLSATVTSVELERINPTTIDLSILDEAQLELTASGVSAKTIASATALPASRTTTLPVSSNPDATRFVTAPSFRGSLTIVPGSVPQGALVLRATVTFRIEVEGV